MTKSLDVAVVGEIFVDHILHGFERWPELGQEIYCDRYVREIGGGTANTACALAKLGRKTAIYGCIGTDDAGWLRARLAACGVLDEALEEIEGASGVTVSVSTSDDRTFFTYPGANRELANRLASRAFSSALAEARHVHFACPISFEAADALFPALRDSGCTISLDAGWHPKWLQSPETAKILRMLDWFFPNRKEASCMTRLENPRLENPRDILRRLGCGIALKLGREGAAMLDGDKLLVVEAPETEVVDTTGAGDAFNAGFLDAFLDGGRPVEWLRRGVICGSLSTRAAGALAGLPIREEL